MRCSLFAVLGNGSGYTGGGVYLIVQNRRKVTVERSPSVSILDGCDDESDEVNRDVIKAAHRFDRGF